MQKPQGTYAFTGGSKDAIVHLTDQCHLTLTFRIWTMTQTAKDVLGIAALVAATALFLGLHSWMFVQ